MPMITDFMSKDHDRLDEILKAFHRAAGSDNKKASSLFSEFKAGLEDHIAWEEDILFPVFEERTGMRNVGPTAVMRHEHAQIKDCLKKIHDKMKQGNGDVADEENMLLVVLTAHNDKEENILYPEIDGFLSAGEREKVMDDIRKVKA